ncbi:MAG: PP2C family protein-serine/threonine phosphatase [Candidatus Sulfotelmatobacter sp.]
MYVPISEMTGGQVLQAFRHDVLNLFFGAVILAVGLVAAAFSAIRRKYDPLLIYLALFAGVYGLRMWIKSDLLSLTMQGSYFYPRLSHAIDFVVPIPAFFFLEAAGFLHRRMRNAICALGVVLGLLAFATVVVGPRNIFYQINGVFVIAALIALVVFSITRGSVNRDVIVIRRGLLFFAGFAMWENIRNLLGLPLPNIEPIGFLIFLAALGYVAARQTLHREKQLGDIQKELEVAKRIQLSILPAAFPNSANFQVAASYVPMTAVAGDFYDFIVANETQAGLLIADVSGHGVPAALIASMVKLAATSQRANATDPSALLAGMNAALCGNTQNQFVTAAYVHLDGVSRCLQYSAAGHPPMLLLRNGNVLEVAENGLMLAAFDFAAYKNAIIALEAGDRLLLYTDGLIEAANVRGDFFGQESLSAVLRKTSTLAPADAVTQIISSVQKWSAAQDDDLTVLVCDYKPCAA